MMIRTQCQNQNGQARRKGIFKDQSISRIPQAKSTLISAMTQSNQWKQLINANSQLSRQKQQLTRMLGEQRERYQNLFEQYQQLVQKNGLIEREYINMKYEHNKALKQFKKTILHQTELYIGQCIDQFNRKIKQQILWQGISSKISGLIGRLAVTAKTVSMFVSRHKREQKTPDRNKNKVETKMKTIQNHSKQQLQIRSQSYKTLVPAHVVSSPYKPTQSDSANISSETNNNQVSKSELLGSRSARSSRQSYIQQAQPVFVNQYYGQLQDFKEYEEKIAQRRNYQLMKKCNKGEGRRKKIFNPNAQSTVN